MFDTIFAPDTGHESDYRAVDANLRPLKQKPTAPVDLFALIQDLEERAHIFHAEGSYGRRELLAHASCHRRALAMQKRPVPPPYQEAPAQPDPTPEELAHLGTAGVHTEDTDGGQRECWDDDGAAYGETPEETFHRD